jgi:hypothetical protein
MGQKVGLLHIGGALPNVALMRLSAYHKALEDDVLLNPTPLDDCDRVYISTLFTWRRREVEALIASFTPHAEVQVGGSGWNLALQLPTDVDTMPHDYDLYGIDYGMGYSSRGCIRKCAFCPVPRSEGGIREDWSIDDLLNPRSNKLMLLDNNFFASDWRPKLAEIEQRGLVVDWPQGNDIRLMTPEIAAALYRLKRRRQLAGDRFTKAGWLHFAWDLPANDARTEEVVAGVQTLYAAGFGPNNLRFYVLIGYPGYSVEEELHRIDTLHGLGVEPYVMVYRDFGEQDIRDATRMDIQHWNNGHAWRKVGFADYDRRKADRHGRTEVIGPRLPLELPA